MKKMTRTIDDLPDISFIDDITYEELLDRLKTDFLEKKQELTGKEERLLPTDDMNIILNTVGLVFYHMYRTIDNGLRQNLLKYATGIHLDGKGALSNCERIKAEKARCKVRFTLSEAQEDGYIIYAGTELIKDGIIFSVAEDCIIKSNELTGDVLAVCAKDGSIGNNISIGELNTLVKPLPYIVNASNIEVSYGGRDEESEYDYANRILNSIYGKSTAGSEPSYEYFIRKSDSSLLDLYIKTVTDNEGNPKGELEITLLYPKHLESDFDNRVDSIRKYLDDNGIRVATDKLTFKRAKKVEIDYNLLYWIDKQDADNLSKIQEKVNKDVAEYQNKLTSKLGGVFELDRLFVILIENKCRDISKEYATDNVRYVQLKPDEVANFENSVLKCEGTTDSKSSDLSVDELEEGNGG